MIAAALAAPPRARFRPILLAGPALAATTLLPPPVATVAALAAIIVLGVPHGALDGELARVALRPRVGHWWFLVFSAPYLLLAALVLLAWQVAPLPTLAAFLLGASWHFGTEEAGADGTLAVVATGGLPVGAAVLAHPAATAAIFGMVSQTPMTWPPAWLLSGALIWLGSAILWTGRLRRSGDLHRVAMPAAMLAGFVLLPPLTAFAIYFVCLHAPTHVRSLIDDPRLAPRIQDERSAMRLAVPVTLLTVLLGAALWPLHAGAAPARLLCLTIQGLGALTLPHMLLECWLRSEAPQRWRRQSLIGS